MSNTNRGGEFNKKQPLDQKDQKQKGQTGGGGMGQKTGQTGTFKKDKDSQY